MSVLVLVAAGYDRAATTALLQTLPARHDRQVTLLGFADRLVTNNLGERERPQATLHDLPLPPAGTLLLIPCAPALAARTLIEPRLHALIATVLERGGAVIAAPGVIRALAQAMPVTHPWLWPWQEAVLPMPAVRGLSLARRNGRVRRDLRRVAPLSLSACRPLRS